MKNKKHIPVFNTSAGSVHRIPSEMHLSVENGYTHLPTHPVRDASLTGCGLKNHLFQIDGY